MTSTGTLPDNGEQCRVLNGLSQGSSGGIQRAVNAHRTAPAKGYFRAKCKRRGAQGPPPSVPHHTVAGEHRLTPGMASLKAAEWTLGQPGHWLENVSLGNKGKAWNPCCPHVR